MATMPDAALRPLLDVPSLGDRLTRADRLQRLRHRAAQRPLGALGRLDETATMVSAVVDRSRTGPLPTTVVVLAADHGVAAHEISALDPGATARILGLIQAGGAPINALAAQAGAALHAVDFGIAAETGCTEYKVMPGTRDISRFPAMSRRQAVQAILNGARLADERIPPGTIVALGEVGVGNTTSATAVTAALTRTAVETITGSGSGVPEDTRLRKQALVQTSVTRAGDVSADPIGALCALGGLEFCGNVGVILAAAARRCCLVIDGYMTAVSAFVAVRLVPAVRDYLVASHRSAEPGHRILLSAMNLSPLLDLGMRLGMASGAAIALSLVNAALAANAAPGWR